MKKRGRKIIAFIFSLFLALTCVSGIAFAEVEADPELDTETEIVEEEATVDADIIFTITGESGYGNWLFLPQWIPVTNAALLAGVTAVDENGDPVEVTIGNVGGLSLTSPQPQDGFPPTPYIITYIAVHPVTGTVFTVTREAYVTMGIEPLAGVDPALGYVVTTGPAPFSAVSSGSLIQPSPTTLSPGEVLVGKSVVYTPNPGTPDGTITVTLSAWARTYVNDSGATSNPLLPMAGGVFVEVTDDIGEFAVNPDAAFPLVSIPANTSITQNGTSIIWDISNQSLLLGGAPITVQYSLTVDNPSPIPPQVGQPPYTMDYWYSTGIANAVFQPAGDNPYYYTRTETVTNAFNMSMNWNNGTGLNSGAIMDNELGITIVFPKNISGQNMSPYLSDNVTMNTNGQWNWWPAITGTQSQAATVVSPGAPTEYYTWQLQWSSISGPKNYIFTVKDLLGPGLDVQYQVQFLNGGGNAASAGGKTTVSVDYFPKTNNSNNNDPFYWNPLPPPQQTPPYPIINLPLDVRGQIMLSDPNALTPPLFQMTINKELEEYAEEWGMDDNSEFVAYIKNLDTDFYLVFDGPVPGPNGNEYTYNGMSSTWTPILFSVNTPAILLKMPATTPPTEDNPPVIVPGVQINYSVTEYPSWGSAPRVSVTYYIDSVLTDPPHFVSLVDSTGDATDVTVDIVNDFTNQPVGMLRLIKLLDGFPADWGITAATEFKVKIWDNVNDNFLLFVQPDLQATGPLTASPLTPDPNWTSFPNWGRGTLFCVGNDGGTGTQIITDSYWEDRIDNDSFGPVIDTISIYDLQNVGLSNIWAGTYDIVELDFNGGYLMGTPPGPAPPDLLPTTPWWQGYTNIQELTRISPTSTGPGEITAGGVFLGTIVNFFQHGAGNLSIYKELRGYPDDWDIYDTTPFTIKIWDMTNNYCLLFDPTKQADGTNPYVGHIDPGTGQWLADDPAWETIINTAIDELKISVSAPVVVSGLYTGSGHHYMVEETDPIAALVQFFAGNQDITGSGPTGGVVVDPSGNVNITVVNTYLHMLTGRVLIDKHLAGAYQQFADSSTEFALSITNDNIDGNTLMFEHIGTTLTSRIYKFVGEEDSAGQLYEAVWDPVTDAPDYTYVGDDAIALGWISELLFSEDQMIDIQGLIPGAYRIFEDHIPLNDATVDYSIDGPVNLEADDAIGLTVTNTYRLPKPGGITDGGDGGGGGSGNQSGTGDVFDLGGWSSGLLLSSMGLLILMVWVRRQITGAKNSRDRFIAYRR